MVEVRHIVKAIGGSMRDGYLVHHVECGLHSGFPPCCIAFGWIYSSLLAVKAVGLSYADMDDLRAPYRSMRGSRRADYYACPACLLGGNIVKAKKCRCHAEFAAHIRRELEETAKRKRKAAGWVRACLASLENQDDDALDVDAADALDRGDAAWHREVIARNRADRKQP